MLNQRSCLFILFLTVFVFGDNYCKAQDVDLCTKSVSNPCVCDFKNGTYIDFSIEAPSDGKEWVQAAFTSSKSTFSWSPCAKLTSCGDDLEGASVCQDQDYGNAHEYTAVGYFSTGDFKLSSDRQGISVYYNGKDARTVEIKLICETNKKSELRADNEFPPKNYPFVFLSHVNCATSKKPDPPGPGTSSGWTPGQIILLIGGVAIIVYIIVSILLNLFVFKKSGIREVAPNATFWIAIPGVVKDGVFFLTSKCRRGGGYEQMS